MKNCSQILAGIERDCAPSMGGVKEVYIAPYADVKEVTELENKVNAITMEGSKYFYTYKFKTGAASMTSTLNVDQTTGNNFVTTDLLLQFTRMETTKRVEISALSHGDMAVIVKDNNDVYWYLGSNSPVLVSAGDGQTGAARTDGNRYTITLQDNSFEFPLEVNPEIIPALLSPGA